MGAQVTSLTRGIQDTWAKLRKTQRIVVLSTVAAVFLMSSVVFAVNSRGPRYETLWSNLDPQDAGSIVTELERQSIPYKLADGGRTIQVPGDRVHRTRLSLASQGLPASGIVGFETIGGNSIWATDFERRVQYVRALSGELTRTVKSIAGVEDARVHIVLPEQTVFAAQRRLATAAVLLKLRPLQDLSPSAVRGIMNFVARSVEGLSPSEVTVMDTSGRLLSQEYGDLGSVTGASSAAYQLTSTVERDLEKRLISMLSPVLGPGNVVCQVRATLNLDQVKTVEDAYSTDPQAPQGILRSTQEVKETYSGTGTTAGGPAGGLDVPTYATGGTGQSSYERSDTTRNYEVNRKTTETLVNPGAIKNLSLAVMVNKELDDEEKTVITQSVTAALGLDPLRQDKISVTGFKFDTSLADQLQKSMTQPAPAINRTYIYAGATAAALVVGTLFLILMRRRRKPEAEELSAARPAAPLPEELQLSPEVLMKQRLRDSVEKMARVQPQTVATLLKTWLLEDEH
jgi:flagellar M-ring protein FliF